MITNTYIENIVNTVVMPIQNGLTYLKNKMAGNNSFFENINNLQLENEALRKKNSELEQALREFEIIKTENETLKERLLATGDEYLEEGTTGWHDNIWGNCSCEKCKNIPGENRLGKILMRIREELKNE